MRGGDFGDRDAMTEEATETKASWRRIGRPRWLDLATAGFLLSVTLALINAYYAARGSEIVVQPPDQVLLYRDGEGERSVLTLAVRLATINAADGSHGDVLMDAEVGFAGHDARFAYTAEVKPVFGSGGAVEGCAGGTRCVTLPGLAIAEQGDGILDVPGGGVRNLYAGFALTEWNCDGADCADFGHSSAAAQALASAPLTVNIELEFFDDGKRHIRCEAGKIDLAYLTKTGWISLSCDEVRVSGDTWL